MITNPAPITIPPTAADTADALWIRQLTFNAFTTAGKVTATAQIVPYSSTTGVMVPGSTKQLVIPDVYAAIAADTTGLLGNAMESMFAAIQAQVVAQNLFPTT